MMQGQKLYALSISHTFTDEKLDQYVKAFKRCGWETASAYCDPHIEGPITDLFIAEQVDKAFAELKPKTPGTEPVDAKEVNCIVIEANLGRTTEFPPEGWLAANLLAVHKRYPAAKLLFYTGVANFEPLYFAGEKAAFSKQLMKEIPGDIDPILSLIQYRPKGSAKGSIFEEVAKEARTSGFGSPSHSIGSPSSLRSPHAVATPVAAATAAGGAGAAAIPVTEEAPGIPKAPEARPRTGVSPVRESLEALGLGGLSVQTHPG